MFPLRVRVVPACIDKLACLSEDLACHRFPAFTVRFTHPPKPSADGILKFQYPSNTDILTSLSLLLLPKFFVTQKLDR
jgi:hypothetical protein